MGSSTRHRTSVTYWTSPDAFLASLEARHTGSRNPPGVRWPLASRLVHKLFRVAPPAPRPERPQLRAVADISDRPPVGYRTKADLLLEVQRQGGLSNQPRRD